MAAWRATGAEDVTFYFTLLAEAYKKVGQVQEGLSILTEALAMVNKTEERLYEAELYRLKGELTLAQSRVQGLESSVQTNQKSKVETNPQALTPNPQGEVEQEVEGYFLKAIEIARKQQAKSWELRASTSLARLWQQQGKKVDAHKLLAEVYNWFTEGLDTKDLQEAKVLLDSLGSGV